MTVRRSFFSRAALALALPVLLFTAVVHPAAAQDSSEFFLRLNRLENQVRDLAGTVEKLEFDNRRLQEQLKRFQEDVEFRFQESSGAHGSGAPSAPPKQKRSDLMPAQPASSPQTTTPATPASSLPSQTTVAQGEKLQPSGENTRSPAVEPATAPSPAPVPHSGGFAAIEEPATAEAEQGHPLDLGAVAGTTRVSEQPQVAQSTHNSQSPDAATLPKAVTAPDASGEEAGGAAAEIPSVAATSPGDPQEGFREAEGLFRRQQYEQAEMGFRQFLQSHPRDKLAPEATFNLGESYFFRGRYREAAEQYLKLTTAYAKSDLVPVGMLKLGMSLEALGARDQACATFTETARKFPDAGPELKQGLARARSRANCP